MNSLAERIEPVSVLIVDDDPWAVRALRMLIDAAADLRVVGSADTGADGVAEFRRLEPDVVLMDVNLGPGMTGVEATAEIVRAQPDAQVVVLTTTAPGPGLARAIEAGAIAALNKNSSEAALVQTIRLAARGESPELMEGLIDDVLISGVRFPEEPHAVPRLTSIELDTLRLICRGQGYEQIAEARSVSPATVRTQVRLLRGKLDAQNLAQLIVRALEFRFIDL